MPSAALKDVGQSKQVFRGTKSLVEFGSRKKNVYLKRGAGAQRSMHFAQISTLEPEFMEPPDNLGGYRGSFIHSNK